MSETRKGEGRGTFEFVKSWGDGMTSWTERWVPDAFVIVIVLSFVTYLFAIIWGFKPEVGLGTRAYESIQAWGRGFWELLAFAMQMCLIMMTGYILACSPPVRRLLDGLPLAAEHGWGAIFEGDAAMLLDGDTGYGNFNNMRRLVRKLEQIGVAGGYPARHAQNWSPGIVKTHRKQDVEALHSHVSCMRVCERVRPTVSYVLRRIRVRVGNRDKVLFLALIDISLELLPLFPAPFPFLLYAIPVNAFALAHSASLSCRLFRQQEGLFDLFLHPSASLSESVVASARSPKYVGE